MTKLIALITTVVVSNAVYAQTDNLANFNKHVVEKWTEDYIRIGQYKVKGTVYLLGEPFAGSMTFANGTSIPGAKILYDTYNQKAGPEVEGKLLEMDQEVTAFTLQMTSKQGGERLLFQNASQFGGKSKGYYNVLYSGPRYSLLKQFRSRLVADPTNAFSKDLKVLEQYVEYFLFDATGKSLSKIRLKEKEVLGALANKNLKGYVQELGLDLSQEKDVVQLLRYEQSRS